MTKFRIYRLINQIFDQFATKSAQFWISSWGENSWVHGRIYIHYPENLIVGNSTTINHNVVINAKGKIKIGNHVHISYGSIITAGGLDLSEKYISRQHNSEEIEIGDGTWIGSGAIILSGVTLGVGSVVAAGSVVTKSVPEFTLVAGVPAKKIKSLSPKS